MKVSIIITVVAVAFFVWAGGRAIDHTFKQVDQHLEQIRSANETP